MKNKLFFSIVFLVFLSCEKKIESSLSQKKLIVKDKNYVIHEKINKGDVRRYGVFPNKSINKKFFRNVLALASKGQPIYFPKGTYETSLSLVSSQNINITFNDVVFTGPIQIIGNKDEPSKNITFKGKVKSLTKFFSKYAEDVQIDSLIIDSDTSKVEKRNLGCSIYVGTQNLSINYLNVKDLGSGDDYYKFSHAALQVHGWNNNPKNISINTAVIETSDRHGVYLTGSGHIIKKLLVKSVGLGDFKSVHGLEDAKKTEIAKPTALWLNKCKNTQIYHAVIDCKDTNADFTVNFDQGPSGSTTIIDTLDIINNKKAIPYTDHLLTNVVVRYYNTSESP